MRGKGPGVLVGMSGGVDSSVAAWLLLEQGYRVEGVTFRLWEEDLPEGEAAQGVEDARRVCRQLGIPHRVADLRPLFREQVVDVFAAQYAAGRTPNPCILCNRHIKLGAFCRLAGELGMEYIATGHYARVIRGEGGCPELLRGSCREKDQSYVLYPITPEQLEMLLLPLGEYSKEKIRALAAQQGLAVAHKPDSQDICFIPDGNHAAFLRRYTGRELLPGNFVDESGKILGPHKGLQRYTVGQRKGLGISLGRTMYVSALSPDTGEITLVEEEEKLFSRRVEVEQVHYLVPEMGNRPVEAEVKLRYAHRAAPALLTPLGGGRVSILFHQPQRAATPGQAAVFYQGDRVLGGGTILGTGGQE